MAINQVAARTEGDNYQGLFFWKKASSLLVSSSKVVEVIFEHDRAAGVDDVTVFYEHPGVKDANMFCTADFYQVKYHMTQAEGYSSDNLIKPAKENSASLLQRFFNAYRSLKDDYPWFRLHLISNWIFSSDDPLAPLIRDTNGAFPETFFTGSSKSSVVRIREQWRQHLGTDIDTFNDFVRRLRLGLNAMGRLEFRESVYDRLGYCGLVMPDSSKLSNSYDSIYHNLLMTRTNKFTRGTFRKLCEDEKLFDKTARKLECPAIGIRSFIRHAENMEEETERFLCVAEHFNGRHIIDPALWDAKVGSVVASFLRDPRLRAREHTILLDCHSSIALLAGYELDQKSGAQVYPVQKGVKCSVWKPTGIRPDKEWQWKVESFESFDMLPGATDYAVAISVTHNICPDVERYITTTKLPISALVVLQPEWGFGSCSIAGGDHAVRLAELLVQVLIDLRRKGAGLIHLFNAAPNGLLFYIGKQRHALGPLQLYEFDFEGSTERSYAPSIRLPLQT